VVALVVVASAAIVASVGAFAVVTWSGGRRKEKGQEGLSARGPK